METKSSSEIVICDNYINGKYVPPRSGKYMDVFAPTTGKLIGKVAISRREDVDEAVKWGTKAFKVWSSWTVKKRTAIMFKYHELVQKHTKELCELINLEHGKNLIECLGEVKKGNETVEWACSLPQLICGRVLPVSRGVECKEYRKPLGVCATVVPYNFPFMVPHWTLPISLNCGNCIILKPSEKVPLTMRRVVQLWKEAGLPDGVLQLVNGTVEAVQGLCDHPQIPALSFVGSTRVAELLAKRGRALNKRMLCLGGAKNHLVAAPDRNLELTAQDVVNSYAGCTGQRCMAASALLTIGDDKELIDLIITKSKQLQPGREGQRALGPMIDKEGVDRICSYLENTKGKILLDGRSWLAEHKEGSWIGPSVILHTDYKEPAFQEEIFGPVLSVYQCKDAAEALAIESYNEYGNAACIYTQSGATADFFAHRLQAGMIGVNIGVPVPREPFSFGGYHRSKFGDCDITADGCVEFFTWRKKVTTKWSRPKGMDAVDHFLS